MIEHSCNKFPKEVSETVIAKTEEHPCYSASSQDCARMHVPVAPKCNISCNYCNRKYDCLHETRPGVTSEVLTPQEAAKKYQLVKNKLDNLTVVGIAGPGDALANFAETKKAIQLIKEIDDEITFCISTNGLLLEDYADEIIELGVNHITITINTIYPKVAAEIYDKISYQGEVYSGQEAGQLLLSKQLAGLEYLSSRGVLCKVNIVTIKGVNDNHIDKVVKKVKEYGAFMTNIMPLIPAEGSQFEDMPLISNKKLDEIRKACSTDLKQMYHCKQCRADAIGELGQDCSPDFRIEAEKNSAKKKDGELLFAVSSKTGRLIDQHFGHAERFLIYQYQAGESKLLEIREVEKYCSSKECENQEEKMAKMLDVLGDCSAILSVRMGYAPTQSFKEAGIKSVETYDYIKQGIDYALEKLNLTQNNLKVGG